MLAHRFPLAAVALVAATLLAPTRTMAQARGPVLEAPRLARAQSALTVSVPRAADPSLRERFPQAPSQYSRRTEVVLVTSGIALLAGGAAIGGDAGGFIMITGGFLALAALVDRAR